MLNTLRVKIKIKTQMQNQKVGNINKPRDNQALKKTIKIRIQAINLKQICLCEGRFVLNHSLTPSLT